MMYKKKKNVVNIFYYYAINMIIPLFYRTMSVSIMLWGIASGEYDSQMLKVSEAAKPKGCFADFVPILSKCG